jgi:O-acetyl-ADP-ribose deacetylase (regulator of RNase III)
MTEKTYKFGKSSLTLRFGDITKTDTQVIVSSDDYYLSMGGGVSASILRAGGNEIALDAAKKVPAKLGDVIITTAGRLKSQFVFHAITIGKNIAKTEPKGIVKSATIKCLNLLNSLSLNSISFPAIGTGVAGFSYEEVAIEMAQTISEYLSISNLEIEVIIYLFDHYGRMQPTDYIVFFEAFASKSPRIAEKEIKKTEGVKTFSIKSSVADTEQEIQSKRLHNLRKLLGSLEDQRYSLEEKLVEYLGANDTDAYNKVKEKLRENEELRLGRLKELKDLTVGTHQKSATTKTTLSVFLSSTYVDLVEHRKRLIDQISRRKMIFIGMEHFGADPNNHPPANKVITEVNNADIYVGVFGVRYGSIDPATGISMTELEFQQAKTSNKKMLLYLIKDTANVKVSDIEKDPIGEEKLEKLKTEIKAIKTVYFFDTAEDLARQLYEDLGKIQ